MEYNIGRRNKKSSALRSNRNTRPSNNYEFNGGAGRNDRARNTKRVEQVLRPITRGTRPVALRINGSRSMVVNGVPISKEEFVRRVQNFSDDSGYQERFGQYAGRIYEICERRNINPMLVVAQARAESNFGESVPNNSKWNYWGLGVYNNSDVGIEFNSIDEAVECYCDVITGYQTNPLSQSRENSMKYSKVDERFTNNYSSIYDLYSGYMYLGDTHDSRMWEGVNAKKFIDDYIHDVHCEHSLYEETTTEEQAAYVAWYVDNKIIDGVEEIFGDSAFVETSPNNPRINR